MWLTQVMPRRVIRILRVLTELLPDFSIQMPSMLGACELLLCSKTAQKRFGMYQTLTGRREFFIATGAALLATRFAHAEEQLPLSEVSEFIGWEEVARKGHVFEHWTPEEDSMWKWYRLERYTSNKWETVGISMPIHKETGEPFKEKSGYVEHNKIPAFVLEGSLPATPKDWKKNMQPSQFDPLTSVDREPDATARARDGRPATEWLRSLTASELRGWLPTVQPPETGVNGMTFWVHLVRDHGFDPRRINGLSEDEFRTLHSAAHYGY